MVRSCGQRRHCAKQGSGRDWGRWCRGRCDLSLRGKARAAGEPSPELQAVSLHV